MFCSISVLCFPSESVKVHLLDQAIVSAPEVTLGEIATIEGPAELTENLKGIFLAWAPEVGRKGAISSYRIKSLLDKEGVENLQVLGMQSTFTTEKTAIPKEEIKTMVTEWIQGELPIGTEADLSFMGLTKEWFIPAGKDVEVRLMLQGGSISASTMVLMEALVDGKVLSSKRIRFKVGLYREVVTLVKPIRRGEVVSRDHIMVKRSNVTRLKGMEIAFAKDALGMVVKRTSSSGKVLTLTDIQKPILVEKGALSSILVKNGPINMTITGAIAMKSGREGDLITFKNPMNPRTILQARITGKDSAQIIIR